MGKGEITKEESVQLIQKIDKNDTEQIIKFGQESQNLLREINKKLNELLKYFDKNLSAELECNNEQITGRNKLSEFKITCSVKFFNKELDGYLSSLNEARLSALAVAIYLSAIKINPTDTAFKILFLDDIFIGLDMSNRLPLLEIIKNEFKDWQIFISTFDRHFYELAKHKLELERPEEWKFFELYAIMENKDEQLFEIPILTGGDSNFEKGIYYCHNTIKPEYPAAANFFRKALEEIIFNYLPLYERVGIENKIQILDYKLGLLLHKTKRFLERIGNSTETLDKIIPFLPALLHPLSHYDVTSKVYKEELKILEYLIPKFLNELKTLDIPNRYRCSPLEGRNLIRIKYTIDATTGHFSFYELRTTEPLILINNPAGLPSISDVQCITEKCWGENNGLKVPRSRKEFSNADKALPEHNHFSLLDAYDKIHSKIIQFHFIGNFPKDANYLDAISYLDQNGNYQPITTAIL